MNTAKDIILNTPHDRVMMVAKEELKLTDYHAIRFLELMLAATEEFQMHLKNQGIEAYKSFGLFGCIVRLTDQFEVLRRWAGQKRRRQVNQQVRNAIRNVLYTAALSHFIETENL